MCAVHWTAPSAASPRGSPGGSANASGVPRSRLDPTGTARKRQARFAPQGTLPRRRHQPRERQRLLLSPALQHHREVKPSARRQGRRVPFEETEGRSSRIHSGFVLTWTRPLCITWCGRAELGLLMRWYLGRKQVCPEIPTTAVRLTWVGHQLKRSPP